MQHPPHTHTLPVIPVPIVAEDGYSCPNGIPAATICPFSSCLPTSFLIFVEMETCGLVMLIASLQKYIPDFYGGLTPLAAEMTKDFFVTARIYPEEYDG
jgi:hypothetical protein